MRVSSYLSEDVKALQGAIWKEFPIRDGLTTLCAEIEDRIGDLLPEELLLIENAVDKRKHEFATVRRLARKAMSELGIPAGPILRGPQREPLWPQGTLGSLSHTKGCAAACVAREGSLRSVGVDLEIAERVSHELHRRLFTKSELAFLEGVENKYSGMMFAAKEAGYKATFPIAGQFIGFQEAEVIVCRESATFKLNYIGDHGPNAVMEDAEGFFLFSGKYVLSLVIIP